MRDVSMQVGTWSCRRSARPIIACCLLVSALGPAAACVRADLVLSTTPVAATPGSMGFTELRISNTNAPGGESYDLSSFAIEVALEGLTGARFTAADTATTLPYVFVNPVTAVFGLPLVDDTVYPFPNTGFVASDSEYPFPPPATGPLFRTINPGDSYGLGRVAFAVDANAATSIGLLRIVESGTTLANADGSDYLPFAVENGRFTVRAVPEPSSVLGAISATLAGAAWRLRPRRRSRA